MFKRNKTESVSEGFSPDIQYIYQFGDQIALNKYIDPYDMEKELKVYKDQWTQYNPRKSHIKRYALSVLNHNGKIGPGPDLDSLLEYNRIHKTDFKESDFNKPTPVWTNSKILSDFLEGIFPYCMRAHFLKLAPGGFFPPHRDHTYGKQNFFRLLVPIANFNPPYFYFMMEEKPLYWEYGRLYVLNTTKHHALFNTSVHRDSFCFVITVQVCKESIDYVSSQLKET